MAEELLGNGKTADDDATVCLVVELVNGQAKVTGPINDRGLCYMLLELAKDAVREHGYRMMQQRQQQAAIDAQIFRNLKPRG